MYAKIHTHCTTTCAHTQIHIIICVHNDPRDADETKSWINEKDTVLSSDDYGRDLASVQALQRKHEGLERDLAALEDKVRQLGEKARTLQAQYTDSSDQIAAKQAEIVGSWEGLKHKVSLLKCGAIVFFICFNRHHKDVRNWMSLIIFRDF